MKTIIEKKKLCSPVLNEQSPQPVREPCMCLHYNILLGTDYAEYAFLYSFREIRGICA